MSITRKRGFYNKELEWIHGHEQYSRETERGSIIWTVTKVQEDEEARIAVVG